MKQILVLVALLGTITSVQLKKHKDMHNKIRNHNKHAYLQYEEHMDDQVDENPLNQEMFIQGLDDWHMPPADTNVQIEDPPKYGEIDLSMEGFDGKGGYEREKSIPQRFTAERDDRLMNSILSKYAIEVNVDGENTGHMFCNEKGARALSEEVLATH